jgi:hypothetical protein
VTFTVDFGHPPDLADVDAFDRPADAFTIQIAPGNGDPLIDPTTVVRSDEVQFGSGITIRDASPADLVDPHAGGWGATRGSVPFTISGNDVSFTSSLQVLGVPDAKFTYSITTSQFGQESGFAEAQSVPLPPAILSGLAMLAFGIFIATLRQIASAQANRSRQMIYMSR